jgi:spore germination cell wall hydrolase CwlJ-like protein
MRFKNAALMALAITIFFGAHAAVDALDRHEEKKAEPVYVVSEPKGVIVLPTEPKVVAVKAVVEMPTEPVTEPEPTYSEADLEMLALVIYQEAGGDACSDDTRLMVGNVVLNRVADERFPDTIEEVLLQERQYGRLHWTGLVWPERASKSVEAHAVERAYKCAERVLNGERLLPEDVIWQAEFKQGTEIVAQQDGFYFCR